MKLITRYVFAQAANAFLLILLSLTGMVWITLALRQLNVVTAQGQGGWTLLAMTTLGVPNFMALIAPFALLIAALQTLSRLNGDSELIVLTAAGAPVSVVARPLLALAFVTAAFVAFANHYVMPSSLRLLRQYIIEVRADLLTQVIQPGRFSSPEQNVTFHIRERTQEGDLLGLIMHDARDPKQSQSFLANRALIVKDQGTSYLVMMDGHILRRTGMEEPARIVAFDRYAVDLDRFEQKDAGRDAVKPRERYTSELFTPDPNNPYYQRAPGQFTSELHERFANPLYPLAFVMIALATIGQARTTRQSRMGQITAGFALAVGCRMAGLAANNVVTLMPMAAPLLYAIPLLAIVGSLAVLRQGPRRGPSAFRAILLWIWNRIPPLGGPSKTPAQAAGS